MNYFLTEIFPTFITALVGGIATLIIGYFMGFFKKSYEGKVEKDEEELKDKILKSIDEQLASQGILAKIEESDRASAARMTQLNKRFDKIEEEMDLIKESLFTIEYDHLVNRYQTILKRGYRVVADTANIERTYESYVKLGGNGQVQALHDAVVKLPLKEEEVIVTVKK